METTELSHRQATRSTEDHTLYKHKLLIQFIFPIITFNFKKILLHSVEKELERTQPIPDVEIIP